MSPETAVIVAAYNEADAIARTLEALAAAFPGARIIVADDGSRDATAAIAAAAGAEVVAAGRVVGKGAAMTLAARRLLESGSAPGTVVLCDADLGTSAGSLSSLEKIVRDGECDVAVASFARRVGGGFGLAVGFAGWAIRRRTGRRMRAPISGQRAIRGDALERLLPFAPRFGMETAMTIDALRAGLRVGEYELELEHRATGRTLRGFIHRGRQLIDFALVYVRSSR